MSEKQNLFVPSGNRINHHKNDDTDATLRAYSSLLQVYEFVTECV